MTLVNVILYILIFCIGTVFGSFFTLAVYRIPLGKDITHERSFCPNCNHKLSFLDLIPVLSYIFLGGKCRYCKKKIRPRYLILEIFSGLVFVLFALSLKLNILELSISKLVYFAFGLIYIATLFITAGIDKEKLKIEKSVLLFGYITEALYIVYLYIVEHDPNVYRYVIYLIIICLLILIDTIILRKNVKSNYTIEILLLVTLILTFTYETVTILTITMTLLIIAFKLLLKKISTKKVAKKNEVSKMPIAFYLCVSNIICLLFVNLCMFYFK